MKRSDFGPVRWLLPTELVECRIMARRVISLCVADRERTAFLVGAGAGPVIA
jgi:hypothetical protein